MNNLLSFLILLSIIILFITFVVVNDVHRKHCCWQEYENFTTLDGELHCEDTTNLSDKESVCCVVEKQLNLLKTSEESFDETEISRLESLNEQCKQNSKMSFENPLTSYDIDTLHESLNFIRINAEDAMTRASNVYVETLDEMLSLSNDLEDLKGRYENNLLTKQSLYETHSNYTEIYNTLQRIDELDDYRVSLSNLDDEIVNELTGLLKKERDMKQSIEIVLQNSIEFVHKLPKIYLNAVHLYHVYQKTYPFITYETDDPSITYEINKLVRDRENSHTFYIRGMELLRESENILYLSHKYIKDFVLHNNLQFDASTPNVQISSPNTISLNNIPSTSYPNSEQVNITISTKKITTPDDRLNKKKISAYNHNILDGTILYNTYEDEEREFNINEILFENVNHVISDGNIVINRTNLFDNLNLEGYSSDVNEQFKKQPILMSSSLEKILRIGFSTFEVESTGTIYRLEDLSKTSIKLPENTIKQMVELKKYVVLRAIIASFLNKTF